MPSNANVHEKVQVNLLIIQNNHSILFWVKFKLFKGNLSRTKSNAKASAALKMCELLDQNGELDDNLLPLSKEGWSKNHLEYDTTVEDEQHKEAGFRHKIGGSKMKRDYQKKVSPNACKKFKEI